MPFSDSRSEPVFVLPSELEPWGLVINEVMSAGKAVIVSDQVGCAPDLVQDGRNGFVVAVGDILSLTERLQQITGNPDMASRMGQESLRRISDWSFSEDQQGLFDALAAVTER